MATLVSRAVKSVESGNADDAPIIYKSSIIKRLRRVGTNLECLNRARARGVFYANNAVATIALSIPRGLINKETNAFCRSLPGIASGMDGIGQRRWRSVLCAVTSGQTRFACHWVSQGHSTVPYEPTPGGESPSRNQAPVPGLPSSLGSGSLEELDQRGE